MDKRISWVRMGAWLALLFVAYACLKEDTLAVVTTNPVTDITASTALSGGTIDTQGGSSPQEYGICWSTKSGPTVTDSRTILAPSKNLSFVSSMNGLSPNTLYHVRAYSWNGAGIAYGEERTFSTLGATVEVELTDVRFEAASFRASYSVNDPAGVSFNSGICWGLTSEPTINDAKVDHGSGTGSITLTFPESSLDVLFARAFVTTPTGTTYSNAMEFGVVYDIDNNRYNLVRIGNRLWTRENLKTSRFGNGDVILKIQSTPGTESSWAGAVAAAYSEVPAGNPAGYGNYYNGYVVQDLRNVCPTGWHVPNQGDVDDLLATVGASTGAGALREGGSSRFTALLAGWRDKTGPFGGISASARFWTTVSNSGNGKAIRIDNSSPGIPTEFFDAKYGFSIRCVKN